jgi:UDP-N-acetylmuramate-alanine ligase
MKNIHPNVLFLPGILDVVEYIAKQRFSEDSLIITMGAGDVYKISEKLE